MPSDPALSVTVTTDPPALTTADRLAHLPELAAAISEANVRLHDAVTELRKLGVPYADIGKALGVSRQAAWERFSKGPR